MSLKNLAIYLIIKDRFSRKLIFIFTKKDFLNYSFKTLIIASGFKLTSFYQGAGIF